MNTPDDELLQLYAQASALDAQHPAPRVREAVMAHARLLAPTPSHATDGAAVQPRAAPANWPSWKAGLVASLLLVPLLGVLVSQMRVEREEAANEAPAAQAPRPSDNANAEKSAEATAPKTHAPAPQPAAAQRAAKPAAVEAVAQARAPAPAQPATTPATDLARGDAQDATGDARHDGEQAQPLATSGASGRLAESRDSAARANTASAKVAAEPIPQTGRPSAAASVARAGPAPSIVMGMDAQLWQAAHDGDLAALDRLVAKGVRLNTRDVGGRTALIWATLGGHAPVVQRLLALGASTELQDNAGLTALQHAQRLGLAPIVALLQPAH